MFSNVSHDLTIGKPYKIVLLFSLPILAGNIFQQFYNIADTIIVGNVLGEAPLAAVGASSVVYNFFLMIANGMTSGFSIVIARYFGAKRQDELKKVFYAAIVLSAVIIVFFTIFGLCTLEFFLKLLQTPEDLMPQALVYSQIVLAAFAVTFIYNLLAAVLRALGNSRTPLIFLVIASIINIVLDILFVAFFDWGVAGASWATVISQTCSVIACVVYIIKKCPVLHVTKKDSCTDVRIYKDLATMGSSMALMFSIVSVGTIILQGAINTLGTLTIAAHTAARKIDALFMMPISTVAVAVSTFVSQNFGAQKYERIRTGIKSSFYICIIWCVFCTLIAFFIGEPLMRFVSGSENPELIRLGAWYLQLNMPFFIILAVLVIIRISLQAVGKKAVPLAASIIETVGKLLAAALIVPLWGYFGVCIVEPLTWLVCAIMVTIDFIFTMRKYRSHT